MKDNTGIYCGKCGRGLKNEVKRALEWNRSLFPDLLEIYKLIKNAEMKEERRRELLETIGKIFEIIEGGQIFAENTLLGRSTMWEKK